MWEGLWQRLEGRIVVLEPLRADHIGALWEVGQDARTWEWFAIPGGDHKAFVDYHAGLIEQARRGETAPFATLDASSGAALGSTSLLTLRPEHKGLEIGCTWLTPAAWDTGANAEAKLLQLEHAFDRLGCMRIEWKTEARNERARRALEALPAEFEGIVRKHLVRPYGIRDSASYSVVDDDWPAVRANLQRRVAAKLQPA
jgi:RimJ/RimL family protein N-acetyltransferase